MDRFWSKVEIGSECWLWTASVGSHGYGQFKFEGVPVLAHRFAYELLVGSIPEGMELDHLCGRPRCVRPEHLEPVSHRINVMRGRGASARNAAKTHCPRGHPYNEVNTWVDPTRGCRECKTCSKKWASSHA